MTNGVYEAIVGIVGVAFRSRHPLNEPMRGEFEARICA
jgi:hypothetical protein